MKKDKLRTRLFYIVSGLFLISAIFCFVSGGVSGDTFVEHMGFIWNGLGVSFLCLGSANKKKANGSDDDSKNNKADRASELFR